MTTTINASPTNGLVATGDGSGVLKVQSNGVTTNALAWVNFNGVTTASIRASYNVSSVTRTSTGLYTVNFTNATTDANYCVATNQIAYDYPSSGVAGNVAVWSFTTSSFLCATTGYTGSSWFDMSLINLVVFGN